MKPLPKRHRTERRVKVKKTGWTQKENSSTVQSRLEENDKLLASKK